ncbi:MAG: hypothetical protein ACKVT2_20865 [Saprospiraceae bacterium]
MKPICNGFGLGFGVQTDEVLLGSKGDCAWPGAYLSYFFIDPTHDGIGILMTQSSDLVNLPLLGDFHQMASAVFVGNYEKDCMDRIIALDDSLGRLRNHACEKVSISQSIQDYTDGLAKIDFQYCPKIFAAGFEKHRMAWLALLPVTNKYLELRGEMHVVFKQIEAGTDGDQFKLLVKTVWDT